MHLSKQMSFLQKGTWGASKCGNGGFHSLPQLERCDGGATIGFPRL
jgi:hypothetical protein